MVQKTFHITDINKEKLEALTERAARLPEYNSAAQVLLIMLEQCWDKAIISEKISFIKERLPKAEIVGINHFDAYDPEEAVHINTVFTFMFFEKPAFAIDRLSLSGQTDSSAGERLNKLLSAHAPLKGVLVLACHHERDIEAIISASGSDFYDVPFFGSNSGALPLPSGEELQYVFDTGGIYTDTIMSISFYGDNLHVRVSYNYGWTPVGKTMTVTDTKGDFCVTEIDGKPAADIYRQYLGLDYTRGMITTINICEFPLILEKDGLTIGRIPFDGCENGTLRFGAAVRKGSRIRFSYGAQHLILSETYNDSKEFGRFSPQGMFMIVCGNRLIFLKDDEKKEIGYYRSICPQLAYMHGNSEIYRYRGAGGELHSALVAVGIREGDQDYSVLQCTLPPYKKDNETVIPLEHRVMTFFHAVTNDLEEMTNRANAANEAKSSFLANMSHDIRTPINAILGMNEMVLRESTDSSILAYSENIRTAGNTLLGLVNDILDFSKIEAGKLDILPVDYDLASVLNDLVNMIQTRAQAKGLELILRIDENIPKLLHGDEIRIKQIITNILTNAVKYTERGSVTFSMGCERVNDGSNDTVILKTAVADTGIGIKSEDLPKLFSQFERIEETRNRSIEGTGLGMNITQRLLSMMNSSLKVESEYGKGSVFSFELSQKVVKWEPVGDYEEAFRRSLAGRKKYREKFTAPKAQLLVIDDTPMNLEVFKSLLKQTLMCIDTAETGDSGIVMCSRKKYDIIFIDHMMPRKDGIETLKEMRALKDSPNAATPMICLTANAVSGAREQYLAAGFDDYITKPVDPDRLEELILSLLPAEKVNPVEERNDEPEQPQSGIPGFVMDIGELNIAEGVRHCGSGEIFMQSLKSYAMAVRDHADEIERLWNAGDIENATIKIHALKSTSRVIGAMRIGELAQSLEAAGNANDTKTLGEGIGGLLERCRRLSERLSPLTDTSGLPLISDDELNEAYTLIREFLSLSDFDSAMQIIDGLEEYSYPDSEKQRCEALKKAASEFDYDAMAAIMEE